jgi:hypothetical protein
VSEERNFILPGTENVRVWFQKDETILIVHEDGEDSEAVELTAAQLAYFLQEYGPFSVPAADPGSWRGLWGTG